MHRQLLLKSQAAGDAGWLGYLGRGKWLPLAGV